MSAVPPNLLDPLQPGLTLGGVVFLNDEHPADLPVILSDRLATHELPGGYKVVQEMGAQPEQIVFSGTLWDQQAAAKKQTIRSLQKKGQPVTLTWNDESYLVYIAKFEATILYASRIAYEITCEVVADLCGAFTGSVSASIDQQARALYDSAQAMSATITSIQSAVAPAVPSALPFGVGVLGQLLQDAGPLATADASDVRAILAQASAINGTLSSYTTALNAVISTYAGAIPSDLQSLSVAAMQLGNVVGLIGANASIGEAPSVITAAGGTSLFALSSQLYGNPTLATVIADANDLSSMYLPVGGSYRLKIPPATAATLA